MRKFWLIALTSVTLSSVHSIQAQEQSDQLKPYLEKLEQESKAKQQSQISDQEKAAQAVQNGTVQVPAIDVKKVSELGETTSSQISKNKSKKFQNKDEEESYENMYLNDLDKYRKIEKSKPYIKNGVVYFSYGVGTPLVICAPKHVCDVQFESGENITNIQIGDATRWIINVRNSDGQTESHVFLKPIVQDISTNLIISTDKRQ